MCTYVKVVMIPEFQTCYQFPGKYSTIFNTTGGKEKNFVTTILSYCLHKDLLTSLAFIWSPA